MVFECDRVGSDVLQGAGLGRKEDDDSIVAFTEQSYLIGVDAEFGDSASTTPNDKQYIRTMCTLRAYLWGTPKGYQDACVSRQCFTLRLTVGIAKGMPMLGNGHKKTDGKVGGSIMGLPRWALSPVW